MTLENLLPFVPHILSVSKAYGICVWCVSRMLTFLTFSVNTSSNLPSRYPHNKELNVPLPSGTILPLTSHRIQHTPCSFKDKVFLIMISKAHVLALGTISPCCSSHVWMGSSHRTYYWLFLPCFLPFPCLSSIETDLHQNKKQNKTLPVKPMLTHWKL